MSVAAPPAWSDCLCRIDETSPLWRMSPREILNSNYEIVVTLDSIVEATGNSTQVNVFAHSGFLGQDTE